MIIIIMIIHLIYIAQFMHKMQHKVLNIRADSNKKQINKHKKTPSD